MNTNAGPTGLGDSHSHVLIFLMLKSMWDSFCSVIGMVGLKPRYLAYFIITMLLIFLVTTVVQRIRGKDRFTLDVQHDA